MEPIVWKNVLILTIIHILALQSIFHIARSNHPILLFVSMYIFGMVTGLGITAGAHRLWSHRAYKAKLPLRILLCFLNCLALETPIYDWVRDHRVHHKYTDTDADPHNAQRGFFFAHMGWLMVKKHKDVTIQGKKLDLSDLVEDPVVMFQKKYYFYFAPILSLLLPALVPWYFFGLDFYPSWTIFCVLRYTLELHATWCVNSVAHFFGNRPYDEHIKPTENLFVALWAIGEGWHNYHHVFPSDYKTAELGNYKANLTTAFIDFMAKIGWAYDLKTATNDMIRKKKEKVLKD